MAFWLARRRNGQYSDFIQRFDPRFWTVDFPRPMMASLVTTGPDSLRIEAEFHHRGELAGAIWESEDRLDHPLLAYDTNRDYSRTVLSFRWRSGGIIPLDQLNGPTLTIEGRDMAGDPHIWLVRLWNYATGTGEDAEIVLPFSALAGGWDIETDPDPVHPADIDRMFISLAPPGYVHDDEAPLPARIDGWCELTGIQCQGHHAMLEIGEVIVPPHDIRMATAYDDSYNQAPARLLRSIRQLGYRERIVHYLGMSHFMRLVPDGGGLQVDVSGTICGPAASWHADFFARCALQGYRPIASLSYELFAEYCPDAWQQRAHDGEAARTGWDPPSALLSPANEAAMGWLQAVAANFVALMKPVVKEVQFQIGEPWWWMMGDGRICLYDDAAVAAWGGDPPAIGDMRAELSPEQLGLLDDAGALLAQSTAALTDAVRAAASPEPAIVHLLAFTPTILDPAMPALVRANMPEGWAHPAFERLQIEDYDWLTSGAQALRRSGYEFVRQRLGYPADKQDYISGFVLSQGLANPYWPAIDAGLEEAAARGIVERFVWALPQVARDGYTRLPSPQENDMQAFDDVLYPLALGRDAAVSPEFSTSVTVTASGHERRSTLWSDARMRYDVGPGVRSEEELGILIAFFRGRRGAARGFRLIDPYDFSSNGMSGTPTMLDQLIGAGDGLTANFRLVKNYGDIADPQIRPITRPREDTVRVSVDGIEADGWALGEGGWVHLNHAPPEGAAVRAGFLFDVPVRFAEDRLDVNGANFAAGEAPSVPLIEIREAA